MTLALAKRMSIGERSIDERLIKNARRDPNPRVTGGGAAALTAAGHPVSAPTVAALLRRAGLDLQEKLVLA